MDAEHIPAENVVVLSEEMGKKPCLELSTDGFDSSLVCVIEAEQSPTTTEDNKDAFGSAPVYRRPFKRVFGDNPDVVVQLPESPVKRAKNESPLYIVSQTGEKTVPQPAYKSLISSYSGQKQYTCTQSSALQADMHTDSSSQSNTLEKDPSQESFMRLNSRLEDMEEESHLETYILPAILMTETCRQVCPLPETLLEQHKHACSESSDTHSHGHTSSGGSEEIFETEEEGEEKEANGDDSDDDDDDDDDDSDDDSDDDRDDSDDDDDEEISETDEGEDNEDDEKEGKEEDRGGIDSACTEIPENVVCPKALVTYVNISPTQFSHGLDNKKIHRVVPNNGIIGQRDRESTMNGDTCSSGPTISPRIAVVPIFSDQLNVMDCEKMTSSCHTLEENASSVTHMLDEVTELNKSIEELRQSFQTDFGCYVNETSESEGSTLNTSRVQSVTNLLDEVTELVESIDSIQQNMAEDVDDSSEGGIISGQSELVETIDNAQCLNEHVFDGDNVLTGPGKTELLCSESQASENPAIKTFNDKTTAPQDENPMSQSIDRYFPVTPYQQTGQLTEGRLSCSALPAICKAMTMPNNWLVKMATMVQSTEQKPKVAVDDSVSPDDDHAALDYPGPVSDVVDEFSSPLSNKEAISVKAITSSNTRSIVCFPQEENVIKRGDCTVAGQEILHGYTHGHEKACHTSSVGLLATQTSSRLCGMDDSLAKTIVSTSPVSLSAITKTSETLYQHPRSKLTFDKKRNRAHGASTKFTWSHSKYRWVKRYESHRPQTTHVTRHPHANHYQKACTSKKDAYSQHLLSRPLKPRKPGTAGSQYKWVKPDQEQPGESGPSTSGRLAARALPGPSTTGQVVCNDQIPMDTTSVDQEPRRRVVLSRLEL